MVEIGDEVEIEMGDDVLIIGWVTDTHIDDHEETVTVTEAHAFHRIWGGSNGRRGHQTRASAHRVKPVRSGYRHIVKEVKERYENRKPEHRQVD
jgi:hypothetical protein